MNGIDVSSYQPANITNLVDYDFAIIKATEGTGYVNPKCDTQYQFAKSKGKLLGVYHFGAGGDAVAEADFFIANIRGYIGEAILILDYEANATSRGAEWVRKFIKRVYDLTKIHPVVYVSRWIYDQQGLSEVLSQEDCGLWLAEYPHGNPTGYEPQSILRNEIIRQYSSTGRLMGYMNNLDLNYAFINHDQWIKYAKGDNRGELTTITVTSQTKSDEEVATEVINGYWSNGDERKRRLQSAGYNYDKIQSIVNSRLDNHVTYVVQPGDTLSAIAKMHRTTWQDLAKVNGLANPNLIYPGQVIKIY